MVQCKYFLIVPAVPEKCWGYNIETLTRVRFSVVYSVAKSWVVTITLSPRGEGAYTRALKSHYPRHPCRHTGQCKRTGGCYNELVVAFFSTGGGVKGKFFIPVDSIIYL